MGRIIPPLLSLLVSASRQELARQVSCLKEETRRLRARLPKKIVATDREKRRLLRAGKKVGTPLKWLMSLVSERARPIVARREAKPIDWMCRHFP